MAVDMLAQDRSHGVLPTGTQGKANEKELSEDFTIGQIMFDL